MDIRRYQKGSYDPEKAAKASSLAEGASSAVDSGNLETALKLWSDALELRPPLAIEVSILLERADALAEWFRPATSGGPLLRAHIQARLELMEGTLERLRELLRVHDPFDIAQREGWLEKGEELVFDPNTYYREEEKEDALKFVNWCSGLCQSLRKAFGSK